MTEFHPPPLRQNHHGEPRRTGFELELAGIEIETCVRVVHELLGGQITRHHSLLTEIDSSALGHLVIELDTTAFQRLAERLEQPEGGEHHDILDSYTLRTRISQWLGQTAAQLIPIEIVTAPLTFEHLPKLEELRESLRRHKAQGTNTAFLYAFGLQFNPEIASSQIDYTRDMLRAFLILLPWLQEEMRIDFSRRLLTFAEPFPERYVARLLAEDYTPDWPEFIADYRSANPTRNRALDLWPLFAYMMPESVERLEESQRRLIKARPTFHYRLPNCEIDDPDWRIATSWNLWVEVEKLAANKPRLARMAKDYLAFLDRPLHSFSDEWIRHVAADMKPYASTRL